MLKSVESKREFYKSKAPTARKLINALICDPRSGSERTVFSYLTRFIKSLSIDDLKLFLRFLTAGNLAPMPITDISRYFEQIFRAPVVRTCSSTITLSPACACYNELAEEITNILRNKNSFSFHFI